YPFPLMARNPLRELLLRHAAPDVPVALKDVECAAFAGGVVAVNHRSTPVRLPLTGEAISQQPMAGGLLPAHSAAFFPREAKA
ncbi:MAG: hypothetical protein ACI4ML_01620, partial [Aristaeellaceae bacterium]